MALKCFRSSWCLSTSRLQWHSHKSENQRWFLVVLPPYRLLWSKYVFLKDLRVAAMRSVGNLHLGLEVCVWSVWRAQWKNKTNKQIHHKQKPHSDNKTQTKTNYKASCKKTHNQLKKYQISFFSRSISLYHDYLNKVFWFFKSPPQQRFSVLSLCFRFHLSGAAGWSGSSCPAVKGVVASIGEKHLSGKQSKTCFHFLRDAANCLSFSSVSDKVGLALLERYPILLPPNWN